MNLLGIIDKQISFIFSLIDTSQTREFHFDINATRKSEGSDMSLFWGFVSSSSLVQVSGDQTEIERR